MNKPQKTHIQKLDEYEEVFSGKKARAFRISFDLWEDEQFNNDVIDDFDKPLEFLTVIPRI